MTATSPTAGRLPGRLVFLARIFGIYWAIFLILRLAFLAVFRPEGLDLLSSSVLQALWVGLKFDARLAAVICLPVLLVSWVPWLGLNRNRWGRGLWLAYLVAAQELALVLYFVDFGTFSYIRTRLNATLLIFMDSPDISMDMVLQSYPWIRLTLLLIGLLIGLAFGLRALARRSLRPAGPRTLRGWRSALAHVLAFLILGGFIYGKVQRYPLRWSDAFVQSDAFLCQFGLNPVLFLYDTLGEEPLNYDEAAARELYPVVAAHLGAEPDPETLSLRRIGRPTGSVEEDWNVVIVFLETFAAFKTSTMGNPLGGSPRFDELAEGGRLFTRFYVPMENTSRSLFGALFGIPDVSAARSSSRNPLVVNQHTVANAFTGYEKFYFLGGSANWGNIRGMLAHNLDRLQIYEEGSYDSPIHDVWGISDADLFREANLALRETREPFLAVIQTAGNHRPFQIPDEDYGFEPLQLPMEELKGKGFYSEEEYVGFQFLDHCLGKYLDWARQEPYFRRTLFVILGDHGTRGGSPDRRYGGLALASVHVPLLLYAPGLLEPGRDERVMSELDLMPTLAGLLGKQYVNQTLGRDVLDPSWTGPEAAFTCTPFRYPPRIGLIEDDFYAILDPDGTSRLHRLSAPEGEADLRSEHPERADRMITLARGYYEMARYLLYHNQRSELDATKELDAAARLE